MFAGFWGESGCESCSHHNGVMSNFSSVFDTQTVVPDAGVGEVQLAKKSSGKRFERVIPLDVEILRLALSAKYVRNIQIAGWTGASYSHVEKRIRVLRDFGFIEQMSVSCRIPKSIGDPKPWPARRATVWRATSAGARIADMWQLAGAPTGVVASPTPYKPSQSLGDHTLGAVDLAVVFRRLGFGVVFEREFKSVEMAPRKAGAGSTGAPLTWCTPLATGGLHAPDLGLIHPLGSLWAVELELSLKPVERYLPVMRSMVETGRGQVWLVDSQAALSNLGVAARSLGFELMQFDMGPGVPPVFSDESGLIRVQRFRGGFDLPRRLSEVPVRWGELVGLGVPGGFSDVAPVGEGVLRRSWSY